MAEAVINGRKYSWASIEAKVDGLVYKGISEISYKQSLKPAKVGGQGVYPLDRTVGDYEAEGNFTMTIADIEALRAALAAKAPNNSYGLTEFDILIQFDDGVKVHTHKLVRCRMAVEDDGHKRSSDPITEKVDVDVMWIEKDTFRMLAPEDAGR